MLRVKRRNTVWLTILGVLVGIAVLSGAVPAVVQASLLILFALAVGASFVELTPERGNLMRTVQRASRQTRISPQAKEATERARRRGQYIDPTMTLIDVGLIAAQSGQEGMVMRRVRSTSKDDDGIRPFITLHVDPEAADRHALIRFEISDHNGQEQYVHEMKCYLRDGEMNILADHQLPLAENGKINGAGDWDMRVYIDGHLTGMHNFVLAPSIRERNRRLAGEDSEVEERYVIQESERELPLSLEELLRSESESRRQSGNNNRRSSR